MKTKLSSFVFFTASTDPTYEAVLLLATKKNTLTLTEAFMTYEEAEQWVKQITMLLEGVKFEIAEDTP